MKTYVQLFDEAQARIGALAERLANCEDALETAEAAAGRWLEENQRLRAVVAAAEVWEAKRTGANLVPIVRTVQALHASEKEATTHD